MGDRGENYKVEKVYGVINSRTNPKTGETTEVKLTKTGWFGRLPKYELRNWTGDYAGSGCVIGIDRDLLKLRDLLNEICKDFDDDEL